MYLPLLREIRPPPTFLFPKHEHPLGETNQKTITTTENNFLEELKEIPAEMQTAVYIR